MFWSATAAFVCLTLLYETSRATTVLDMEKETLKLILAPDNYDSSIRPVGRSITGPVIVKVNTFIRSIHDIDDVKMEFNTQLTFRMTWFDSRLQYDDRNGRIKYLTLLDHGQIWKPDTFFSNEREGYFHNIVSPNVMLRIYPDGKVSYSIRISLELSCPMDLANFPMDNQVCSIAISNYGYIMDDVVLQWKSVNPVQYSKNILLPRYNVSKLLANYCISRTVTEEYSCIKVDLIFSRKLNYYILKIYIPYTFMLILSWMPFWLNYRKTTARVTLWAFTVLATTVFTISIQPRLPDVSYATSIDVWSWMCLTFLFGVIIELAIVSQVIRGEDSKQENATLAIEEKLAMSNKDLNAENSHRTYKLALLRRWLSRFSSKGLMIDVISRILFPLAFAFFNLVYWSSYARRGD